MGAVVNILSTTCWLFSDNALIITITDAVVANSNCCVSSVGVVVIALLYLSLASFSCLHFVFV